MSARYRVVCSSPAIDPRFRQSEGGALSLARSLVDHATNVQWATVEWLDLDGEWKHMHRLTAAAGTVTP